MDEQERIDKHKKMQLAHMRSKVRELEEKLAQVAHYQAMGIYVQGATEYQARWHASIQSIKDSITVLEKQLQK